MVSFLVQLRSFCVPDDLRDKIVWNHIANNIYAVSLTEDRVPFLEAHPKVIRMEGGPMRFSNGR